MLPLLVVCWYSVDQGRELDLDDEGYCWLSVSVCLSVCHSVDGELDLDGESGCKFLQVTVKG